MLLSEKKELSKRSFLKKRMEAIYMAVKSRLEADNPLKALTLKNQNTQFRQFTIHYNQRLSEYQIINHNGNGCLFFLGITYMSRYINVNLYDVKYHFLLPNEIYMPYFLYDLLEQFENIEKGFLQMIDIFDEMEKSANIIRQCVDEYFSGGTYDYYVTETENRIILSVVLHGRILSIPIYYSKYKKILPHISSAIKDYENLINSTKIKVLILEKTKKR